LISFRKGFKITFNITYQKCLTLECETRSIKKNDEGTVQDALTFTRDPDNSWKPGMPTSCISAQSAGLKDHVLI